MKETYKIAYYLVFIVALLIGLFTISTDFCEVLNRIGGHMTVMSQIYWFSDNLAILYCSISGTYYLIFLCILCRKFYLKKYKPSVIIASIIFVSFIIQFVLESKYIYYQQV